MKQNNLFQDLINLLMQCEGECIACTAMCMEMPGMELCMSFCNECAAKCRSIITSNVYSEGDWKECAKACSICADECEEHENDHCNKCAAICRKCEQECRMVALHN